MKNKHQQLPGKVIQSIPGLKGFDTNHIISEINAVNFKKQRYSFCIRYLSRGNKQQKGDLSFKEANDILNAGLALSVVQHVSRKYWEPTETLGSTYGKNAASNANSIGLPKGLIIWCDLEEVSKKSTSNNVIAYSNAWYNAVFDEGYIPGLYVGANCKLNGEQLYENLKFKHYWKSMSNVPFVVNRGYQMIQHSPTKIVNGISIDENWTHNDHKEECCNMFELIK